MYDLCRCSRRPLACRRRRLGLCIWTQCSGLQRGKPKATDEEQVELVSPVTLSCLRQVSKVVTGEQVELVSPVNLIHLRLSGGAKGRDRVQLATAPTAPGPNLSPRESVVAAFADGWQQCRPARRRGDYLLPGLMALAPWANPTWEQQLQQQLTRTRPRRSSLGQRASPAAA